MGSRTPSQPSLLTDDLSGLIESYVAMMFEARQEARERRETEARGERERAGMATAEQRAEEARIMQAEEKARAARKDADAQVERAEAEAQLVEAKAAVATEREWGGGREANAVADEKEYWTQKIEEERVSWEALVNKVRVEGREEGLRRESGGRRQGFEG